ncbi:MAG TPA: alpha/beta hydrolase [Opitutaceae bacterium]|nr:alpha/beta hydrolase [Opitutaceae bacterium]
MKTDYNRTSNLVYTSSEWPRPLKADLYQPEGEGPWPAVVLIYGGSWDSKDHRWWMTLLARKLAKRGFIVLNAAYRGTPEFQYPAPVDDLRQALRWLRTHASELQLSPDRIAVYGFSAGGHLASLLGTLPAAPEERVQAVVAFSAPSDLTLFPGGEILPRFLGGRCSEKPELFRDASPLTYVTADDPPFFLYHGTADTTVDPEHSRRLQAALQRAGVPNELIWVEGRGHAAMLFRAGAAEDAAVDFLDRTLRR